mgnify:CR=1 FL=1
MESETVEKVGYSKVNPTAFPSVIDHIAYKQENYDNIKVFNFLNKKPRDHRMWMFDNLREWNLIDKGIVSMNQLDEDRELNIDFNIRPKSNIIKSNKLFISNDRIADL